jgi:hypothetical protein
MKLPKGCKVWPDGVGGVRFETPTTFGWARSAGIALAEIEGEIRTGKPAWRIGFGESKRGLKRERRRAVAEPGEGFLG